MNELKQLGLISSAVLQSVYVVGLIVVVNSLVQANLAGLYEAGDPRLMAGFISSQAVRLLLAILVGLVGVILMATVIRKIEEPPIWMVHMSAVFAIAWILLIPVGTPIGIYMFRWRARELRRFE